MAPGILFGHNNLFTTLSPLTTSLTMLHAICIHLFSYIQGFEGTVRLLSTTRGQVKKIILTPSATGKRSPCGMGSAFPPSESYSSALHTVVGLLRVFAANVPEMPEMRCACPLLRSSDRRSNEPLRLSPLKRALARSSHRAPVRPNRPKRSHARSSSSALESLPPSSIPVRVPFASSMRDVVPPSMITVSVTTTSPVACRAPLFGPVNPAAGATPTAPRKPA